MWNVKEQGQARHHLCLSVTMSNHTDLHRAVAAALLPLSKSRPNCSTTSKSSHTEKGILGNIIQLKQADTKQCKSITGMSQSLRTPPVSFQHRGGIPVLHSGDPETGVMVLTKNVSLAKLRDLSALQLLKR